MSVVLRLPVFKLEDWGATLAMLAMVWELDAAAIKIEGGRLEDGQFEVRRTSGDPVAFEDIVRRMFPQYVVEMENVKGRSDGA